MTVSVTRTPWWSSWSAHPDRRAYRKAKARRATLSRMSRTLGVVCDLKGIAGVIGSKIGDEDKRLASALLLVVHGDIVHSDLRHRDLHKLFMLHGANPIRLAIKASIKCTDLDAQMPA